MLTRRSLLQTLGAGAAALALPGRAWAARADDPAFNLRLGTMFIRDTPWAKVLSVWGRHLEKSGYGNLGVKVQHNGSERVIDETEVARRLSVGLLDGAMLSTVGLGTLVPAAQALHLPRLYADWDAGDRALTAARDDLERAALAQGLTVLGWGKLGARYLLGQDAALRSPADLAAQLLYTPKGDRVLSTLAQTLGVVGPVELDVIAVQQRIRKGVVNTAICTATQAISRGWVGNNTLNRLTALPLGFEWGALVLRTDALAALPEDLRALVQDTAPLAARNLDDRAVELDGLALQDLQQRVEVLPASDSEAALWDSAGKQVVDSLVKAGWISQDLIDRMRSAA